MSIFIFIFELIDKFLFWRSTKNRRLFDWKNKSYLKGFGIDRIDNSKGYIEGNMVPCCKICNWMKSDKSSIDFIQKCKDISNKFNTLTSQTP